MGKSWSKSEPGAIKPTSTTRDFRSRLLAQCSVREWGFLGMFQGTTGDWKPFTADVWSRTYTNWQATRTSLRSSRSPLKFVPKVEMLIERARSLAAKLAASRDSYLTENVEDLQRVSVPGPESNCARLGIYWRANHHARHPSA